MKSFPGFGSMIQQIIPGQVNNAVRAPSYPPPQTRPQPSCWISASPTSVAFGKSSKLQWSSFNASHATITDFGTVPTSGTRTTGNLTSDRAYQLNVSGQGGSGSCYARVDVQGVSGLPTCAISANPNVVRVGQSANLAWGSQNSSSASLSGIGAVSTNGGTQVAPRQTTTYSLTVSGPQGGSVTCTTQIGVLP